MAGSISSTSRVLIADALATALNSGKLQIYSGTVPSSVNSTPQGLLLAVFSLGASAFMAATDNGTQATATANSIPDATGINSGTPTFGRLIDASSNALVQVPVADLDLSVTSVATGANLECNSCLLRIA